jgi:hypothetical protein
MCQASSLVDVYMPKDICTMHVAAHQQECRRGEVGPERPSPGLNEHFPNRLSHASLKSMNISLPHRSWVLAPTKGTVSSGEACRTGHTAHLGSGHLAYATWRASVAPRPCRSFSSCIFSVLKTEAHSALQKYTPKRKTQKRPIFVRPANARRRTGAPRSDQESGAR